MTGYNAKSARFTSTQKTSQPSIAMNAKFRKVMGNYGMTSNNITSCLYQHRNYNSIDTTLVMQSN